MPSFTGRRGDCFRTILYFFGIFSLRTVTPFPAHKALKNSRAAPIAHLYLLTSMAGLQLAGLASGFDWQSLVDSLISLERTPISRMETEQVANLRKNSALGELGNRMRAFNTANEALSDSTLFTSRTVTSSGSGWSLSAATGTATGSQTINVTRLATAAVQRGVADVAQGIAPSSDVSGITLAALPTASAVKGGVFTVNGAQVSVATTDSLQDVFDKIATATGGTVTASYDETTDSINLNSASEIVLGAANDTSNFLAVAKLANNGTGSVSSNSGLGTVDRDAALVDARLKSAITAVDGSGNGTFTINGVAIDYNINDDSIDDIIERINAAGAGVNASYDAAADRMNLSNTATGDLGIGLDEAAGGLLSALGLTGAAGGALTRGVNAQFSINGGATLTSTSNTLTSDVHGIAGLSVTVGSVSEQTVSVAANTEAMRTKIDAFIAAFNSVQTYIEDATKITATSGSVSAATLSSNREIQDWARQMRGNAFAQVSGLSGTVSRLESLGIDFTTGTNKLEIKDSAKLNAALSENAADVDAFFNTAGSGFFDRMDAMLKNYIGDDGNGGYLKSQQTSLTDANASLDRQIDDAERRLEQRRQQLEAGFIAMELAQQKIQLMSQQLSSTFFSSSSNSSSSSGSS